VHGIASKANVYNLQTSPKVIEEGMNAAMELIYYLVADGFKIKTPLFNVRMRLPGEYDGSESGMPHGVFPAVRRQTSAKFRNDVKNKVKVMIDGIDQSDGLIAEAIDESTGVIDETMTIGNLLTIRGWGLKIVGEEENGVGLYFAHAADDGAAPIKAEIIAVNEPRTLKVIVPPDIKIGETYYLKIITQSSTKNSVLLKSIREIWSEFALTGQ
jgi:hypothetical protein